MAISRGSFIVTPRTARADRTGQRLGKGEDGVGSRIVLEVSGDAIAARGLGA